MKYKLGDKVKIREGLDIDKIYGGWDCSEDMIQYGGKIATIVKCYDDSYHIDVDDECYDWTDEMFEDYTEDTEKKTETRRTVDVGFHFDYCGHRVLEDVLQGETGKIRYYYTKDYEIQYIIPIENIDFIVPHEVD